MTTPFAVGTPVWCIAPETVTRLIEVLEGVVYSSETICTEYAVAIGKRHAHIEAGHVRPATDAGKRELLALLADIHDAAATQHETQAAELRDAALKCRTEAKETT